jgi:glycerophosphoryl diester phosphodiesterase
VSKKQLKNTSSIEVQGHRGDRGNFPENSLEAFISAIDKGVDVIELDIVVSKDKKIVISHEPFMSSQYVSLPDGTSILKEKEKSYNLYQMTYDSIKKFDAGSKGNPGFPKQKRIKTYKPLLSELIDSVENYIVKNKLQRVRYNIEIKSSTNEYDISQPQPERFVEMVMELVKKKGVQDKINIQSFDPAILNALYKKYPAIKTAFLAGNKGLEENLSKLNFLPQIYSPYYKLVNKPLVDSVKALKMRIIPWTVNEEEDIDKMIKLKVDGIITDFPEKVLKKL